MNPILDMIAEHDVVLSAGSQLMRRFVDTFGAERILCGTDIGQTRGPYARIVGQLRDSLALLGEPEREAVLFGTASRIFGPALE